MSNLVEQIIAVEEGKSGDAIILIDKKLAVVEGLKYRTAYAIIRYMPTMGGRQWVLSQLTDRLGGPFPMAGSGMYGDINYVTRMAETYYSDKSDNVEWVQVNYTDPDYPPNLLPM